MKVAFLTNTTEVRPEHNGDSNFGDCLIGHGLKYLIEMTNPSMRFEWVDISRFSVLSEEDKAKMKECDVIVYAGMPQYNIFSDWSFYYDDGIYDDIKAADKPFYKLAGGFGSSNPIPTVKEAVERAKNDPRTIELINKACSIAKITTVRDRYAHEILNALSIKNTLLPCPASYSLFYKSDQKEVERDINLFSITSAVLNPSEFEVIKNAFNLMRLTYPETYFICQNYKRDYDFLVDHNIKKNCIIQPESVAEFKTYLRRADKVFTTRLHTALPAFVNKSKVILFKVDTRASAAYALQSGLIPLDISEFEMEMLTTRFQEMTDSYHIGLSTGFYEGIFSR